MATWLWVRALARVIRIGVGVGLGFSVNKTRKGVQKISQGGVIRLPPKVRVTDSSSLNRRSALQTAAEAPSISQKSMPCFVSG